MTGDYSIKCDNLFSLSTNDDNNKIQLLLFRKSGCHPEEVTEVVSPMVEKDQEKKERKEGKKKKVSSFMSSSYREFCRVVTCLSFSPC